MAFLLTPRFAQAFEAPQCNPFGFCAPASRPAYAYRISRPQPRRPQYSSFNHFFNQVDELLTDIDREAQRQAHLEARLEQQHLAHRQRQQRKHALRAKFAVSQNDEGWQVDGDIQGFDQENISIEVTSEHTLKISGNTHWQSQKEAQVESRSAPIESSPAAEQCPVEDQNDTTQTQGSEEAHIGVSAELASAVDVPEIQGSDTDSHKSYQPTVEDDFEDLGAETSSLISASSGTSTPVESSDPKGKEKVNGEPAFPETTATTQQVPPEFPSAQSQDQTETEERPHGSFERTFKFPERIDGANVSASFKAGALRITVPKAQVLQIRRIAIL